MSSVALAQIDESIRQLKNGLADLYKQRAMLELEEAGLVIGVEYTVGSVYMDQQANNYRLQMESVGRMGHILPYNPETSFVILDVDTNTEMWLSTNVHIQMNTGQHYVCGIQTVKNILR